MEEETTAVKSLLGSIDEVLGKDTADIDEAMNWVKVSE